MKKNIFGIMLGLSLVGMKANVGVGTQGMQSFVDSVGNSLANSLFGGLFSVVAKYNYSGIELLGETACYGVSIKNESVFEQKKGKEALYFNPGGGLRFNTALGSESFQLGAFLGGYLKKNFVSFDPGLFLYFKYSSFFVRVGSTYKFQLVFFEKKGVDQEGLSIQSFSPFIQWGYYFHGPFYVSLMGQYNYIRGASTILSNERRIKNCSNLNGISIYVTLGINGSASESRLESIIEEEELKEIAKLRARDKYEAEKKLAQRKIVKKKSSALVKI